MTPSWRFAPSRPRRGRSGNGAVTAYARDLSRREAFLDNLLPDIVLALGEADDAATLDGVAIGAETRTLLERAAPIYRKAWWPAHNAANRAWRSSMQALLDRHGQAVLAFIVRAYGQQWPAGGFPVHASGYANWSGAYSTLRPRGSLLVLSSLYKGNEGLLGLELLFHEAMHQWDNQMATILRTHAIAANTSAPGDLSHALIFFTPGEAVRRVEPRHVPSTEVFGIWKQRLSGSPVPAERLRPLLMETWKPYLDGDGTRDTALGALLVRVPRCHGSRHVSMSQLRNRREQPAKDDRYPVTAKCAPTCLVRKVHVVPDAPCPRTPVSPPTTHLTGA
jgi:hypothetical protein